MVGLQVLIDCILKPSLNVLLGQPVLRQLQRWAFLQEMKKFVFWPDFFFGSKKHNKTNTVSEQHNKPSNILKNKYSEVSIKSFSLSLTKPWHMAK